MRQKRGPKPEEGSKRERMLGGRPVVLPSTNETLKLWHDLFGVSYGKIIDGLIGFARHNPAFKLKVKKARATKLYAEEHPAPEIKG